MKVVIATIGKHFAAGVSCYILRTMHYHTREERWIYFLVLALDDACWFETFISNFETEPVDDPTESSYDVAELDSTTIQGAWALESPWFVS